MCIMLKISSILKGVQWVFSNGSAQYSQGDESSQFQTCFQNGTIWNGPANLWGKSFLKLISAAQAPNLLLSVKSNKKIIKACLCPFQALAVVMSYLTDQRRGHSTILWLNLQEELVLEANGQMFTPREPGCLEQPIPVCVQDPLQLQVQFCSGM